jgi:phosphoglucosamine mutase
MRCVAGIVISASHNPYQDNGIKIFASSGFKLSDELENEIESLIATGRINDIRPTASEVGRAKRIDDAVGRYIEFCKDTFPASATLEGVKIVLDCANGATYHVAPDIFRELGAEVVAIHDKPNGLNINDACGSQHTDDLRRAVRETGADIGLAFDGDGDRLIAVDEQGVEISGDHIIAICARHLKEVGKLRHDLVILTPMSNLGLRLAFRDLGIQWKDAGVGDRLVLELMQREDAALGGEQSGHVIFRDLHTTGDGIVTALQLLAVMRASGQGLSQLATVFRPAPQVLINIDVRRKPPIESLPGVARAIQAAEKELGDAGRVLVRYSGTQSMCRVMVEAASEEATNRLANAIADEVRKAIA